MKKKRKERFVVEEGETITDCLNRMKSCGYTPVRRVEEPVLKEVMKDGKTEIEVAYQRIVFEGTPLDTKDETL